MAIGVKVSVAATIREGLVLGMLALPGNPYDGHTLAPALDQIERLTGSVVERAYVDRAIVGMAWIIGASSSPASVAG